MNPRSSFSSLRICMNRNAVEDVVNTKIELIHLNQKKWINFHEYCMPKTMPTTLN